MKANDGVTWKRLTLVAAILAVIGFAAAIFQTLQAAHTNEELVLVTELLRRTEAERRAEPPPPKKTSATGVNLAAQRYLQAAALRQETAKQRARVAREISEAREQYLFSTDYQQRAAKPFRSK
jgi:hypothetical protein